MRALGGLISIGVNNPVLANLLMGCMLIGGWLSVNRMIHETYPEFALDRVTIDVAYPGASPDDVEAGVVTRIERAIQGVDGIEMIQAFAMENRARIWVELVEGIPDATPVTLDIKDKVEQIRTFPAEVEKPVIREQTSLTQVINVAVHGDMPERTLDQIAREVRDELLSIHGVTLVHLFGVRNHEIIIEISEEALRRYGLSFDEVAAAVAKSTVDLPAGILRTRDEEITLRTVGQRYTARDFEDVVLIARVDGTVVRLHQVATVTDGFEESSRMGRFNGTKAAMITVDKTPDQDAAVIASLVRDYVQEKQAKLPDAIRLSVWGDASIEIDDRLDMLIDNALMGILLVFGVLMLFLNLRISLYVALGVPVAFAGAFVVMFLTGETINMISLLALIMVTGIVVDDAIVIAERVDYRRTGGDSPREAVLQGTTDVSLPVVGSAITTMLAFAPLMYVRGVVGSLVAILPVVVIIALLASLAEAFLVLPAHLVHAGGPSGGRFAALHTRVRSNLDTGLGWVIARVYRPVYHWSLAHRGLVACIFVAALILVVGWVASGRTPLVLMPQIDGNTLRARVRFPEGTAADVTQAAIEKIERGAMSLNGAPGLRHAGKGDLVRQVFSVLGVHSGYVTEYGSHLGDVSIELMPAEERRLECEAVVAHWRDQVGDIPGAVSLTFEQVAQGPQEKPLEIRLMCDDLARLDRAAEDLKAKLREFSGVYDVEDKLNPGKRELHIALKPAARTLGLTTEDLARQIRAGFFGGEAVRIQRGRDEVTVRVRYPQAERAGIGDIERMRVRTLNGEQIPFREVAEIRMVRGYAMIPHQHGERRCRVLGNIDESTTNAEQILHTLDQEFLPDLARRYDLEYSFEGQHAVLQKSVRSLFSGYVMALVAIYTILGAMLRSYTQPVVIMAAVPMGVVGAVVGHWVMGYQLTMFSLFGVVALSGVVVNDSLVLLDQINRFVREGRPVQESVGAAGEVRFRAVILTTVTTVAGLVPLLSERSTQAQTLIPMAISLAFGLAAATVLTLIFVPTLYLVVNDVKRAARWLRWGGPYPTPESVESGGGVPLQPGSA